MKILKNSCLPNVDTFSLISKRIQTFHECRTYKRNQWIGLGYQVSNRVRGVKSCPCSSPGLSFSYVVIVDFDEGVVLPVPTVVQSTPLFVKKVTVHKLTCKPLRLQYIRLLLQTPQQMSHQTRSVRGHGSVVCRRVIRRPEVKTSTKPRETRNI